MPDYQQGKIYKIFNTVTDDIYIGSTTQLLCNRMKGHRNDSSSKKHSHYKLHECFCEHGVANFYIELLEKYPCSSKEELFAREGYWIKQEKPTLNIRVEGRTDKKYYQDNKEYILQRVKEYAKTNREQILQRKREYQQRIKDSEMFKQKRKEYAENNKERIAEYQKQYRADNIEYLKQQKVERGKKYRDENKDTIKAYDTEQITCECGCVIQRGSMGRHKHSQRHKDAMDTKA